MKHLLLRSLCVVAAFGIVIPLSAGTTGKIAGTVIEAETGTPLIGTNVIVEEILMGSVVDQNGEYAVINVPPGTYDVRAEMIGFGTVRMTGVSVSVDLTTPLDFQLSTEIIAMGDAVEVVAYRAPVQIDLTSSSAVVDANEIDALPVEEVADILELQAGVVKGLGGIHVRGGRTDEVAYWVDGVPTTDVYEGGRAIEVQNSAVEELQVISGTFNAEYGQAMSGIVNIVTNAGSSAYQGAFTTYVGDNVSGDDALFENVDDVDAFSTVNSEFTLSGPVPGTNKKVTFFALGRYNNSDGYLYGKRVFNAHWDWETGQGILGDSATVPMNPSENLYLQGKAAWRVTDEMRLTYGAFWEEKEYKDYSHDFKYNPDGTLNRFVNGSTHIVTFTHTLSPSTFYELKGTRLEKTYKHYAYEDANDSRYMHPDVFTRPDEFTFWYGGSEMQRFERSTNYWIAKGDLVSQINKRHQLKGGLELRLYNLTLDDAEVRPKTTGGLDADGNWDILAGSEIVPFEPTIHPLRSPYHDAYDKSPTELSTYIQDKIEFKEVIVNVGLRFDYFEPDGVILADPKDPDVNNPILPEHQYNYDSPDSAKWTREERSSFWYEDASAKYQVSPRLGVAYPITDRGAIHFSYGHFFQIPKFQYLYENPEFEVARGSGLDTKIGNADLEPQKTVMYEIGLQQALTDVDVFDVTMFYRDIRDWVGTSEPINTYAAGTAYSKYENKDYANVRGVTLTYDRRFAGGFGAGIDYSFMIVEGTASDAADAFEAAKEEKSPRISLIPLGWDQTHTMNANLAFGSDTWRATLLGRFATGGPYTPEFPKGEVAGSGQFVGLQENSQRKPNTYSIDLKAYKKLTFGRYGLTVFANVYNLLDTRNEEDVYATTGRATYDLNANAITHDETYPNTVEDYVMRPDYYSEPRKIHVGVTLTY